MQVTKGEESESPAAKKPRARYGGAKRSAEETQGDKSRGNPPGSGSKGKQAHGNGKCSREDSDGGYKEMLLNLHKLLLSVAQRQLSQEVAAFDTYTCRATVKSALRAQEAG